MFYHSCYEIVFGKYSLTMIYQTNHKILAIKLAYCTYADIYIIYSIYDEIMLHFEIIWKHEPMRYKCSVSYLGKSTENITQQKVLENNAFQHTIEEFVLGD